LPVGRASSSGCPRRVLAGAVFGLVGGAALFASPAAAAEARFAFDIPAQPLQDALVSFGLQAGVSVGAGDLSRCRADSQTVSGRLEPAEALSQLLAGTGCGFRRVDDGAFSVAPRAVAPAPAAAATHAAVEDKTVQVLLDLTVTTTRRPSLVSRTPASVSVASGEGLVAGRHNSLQDIAPEFAGVTITNMGPGRNKILVRGLSDGAFTGRTQSMVGLYLDDAPITYNAPDPDLRLVDVERVELMRGPQGTLYGVGSMGGVMRIVTRKPDLEHASAGVAASVAATDGGAASYSADAVVNAVLVPDRLALRAVAYSETAGGYVDDTAIRVKNANTMRRTGGRLAAALQVSPDWLFTAGATGQALRSDDSQYAQGGLPGLQRTIPVREPHHNDFIQAYASLEGPTALGRLKLSAAYLDHAFDTRYDASLGLEVFSSPTVVRTFDQSDKVRLAVAEAVLSSPTSGRLQWLAGAFAARASDDLHMDLTATGLALAVPLYIENRGDRLGEVAVYGEAAYAITRDLSLTVGARAFQAWLKTRSVRDQGGIILGFEGSRRTSDISPKVVLSWQASPSKLFYLQAAQGYRMGGFNTTGRTQQQFDAAETGDQPNRRYRPDTLWSFEAGVKASFADRRLETRAAAFYTDWRDIQSDQFFPSGLPYTANVGRGVNTGIEGEAALRVDRSLTVRLSAMVNGPQLKRPDPTYPASADASLPAVPRYSASLAADWRRELHPGLAATVYGRLAYVGSSILTFQERASSAMGNYVTARFAAGLEGRSWRLTAYVDNPTNARGDTFAFGDPFTQGRVRQFTPLRPRTVGLSFSYGL